ncbi:caspase family protein [Kutzneria buriramensis]|uniref:Putative caspase-like protein n=1 Tax=Kutzneria buriramensis TaxID=1045776 RepID=A0A3E0I6V5_9PSEU|nr:caspase family protein [Kutzneria buriramensis]REH54462.1 putative caspase-like protein [Kutzneria buriramensis]
MTAQGRRRALIVATGSYEHKGLRRLAAPAHDADALRAVLADPELGGFEVEVARDLPAHQIQRRVADFLAGGGRDDVLLLHFSCHGLKNAAGELFLAGTDTVPDRLSATAVPARFVNDELAECRAAHVALLLDCCFGGAFAKGSVSRSVDDVDVEQSFPLRPGRSRVVITASSATEYAFEGEELAESGRLRPSLFTEAVVEGLRTGDADLNGDGSVDLDELYKYVYARVTAATAHQTPHQSGGGHGASLLIARTPLARRVGTVDVEESLAARAKDPDAAARLAAVGELRTLLVGDDVSVAAGALTVLQALTGDDSVSVRTAAAEALVVAQLRPSPAVVELGEDTAQAVAFAGAPLARIFHVTTETRWLRVSRDGGAVIAQADPAAYPEGYGELRGDFTVITRLGPVVVPVVCRPAGRLWARASIPTPDLTLFHDWRVLFGTAVVELVVVFGAAASMLESATFLGFLYEVLRWGPLLVGIRLMEGDGFRRPVGYGMVAANAVFLLVDGLGNVHTTGGIWSWLQLALAVAVVAVLGIRLWPFEQVPRRIALVPPTQRPLAWVTIGAAAVELILLLSAIPTDAGSFTIGGVMGPVAGLLAVVPWAGLCVLVVLARTVSAPQRLFVTAAVVAYAGPEVVFMLGSILLGANFTYVGDDVWDAQGTAAWFPLLHAAVTTALAGTAVARVYRRV